MSVAVPRMPSSDQTFPKQHSAHRQARPSQDPGRKLVIRRVRTAGRRHLSPTSLYTSLAKPSARNPSRDAGRVSPRVKSSDAAGHALCAVTSARESRLYCSGGLHAKLASHCHVVQECSNLVSGEYAGNRALDCIARAHWALRCLRLSPAIHSPMRALSIPSVFLGVRAFAFRFLTDRRLLFVPLLLP